ncbi:MAG: lysophospholipid acyltransferase family protein [Deltaproteobacteria bacterium]|nr:lysophospholipid acyltransferase family protein [Deltaproteobacteria bacterium]
MTDPSAERTFMQRLLYTALRTASDATGRLGHKNLRRIAMGLGAALWHSLPSRRALAIRNIRDHLSVPEAEAKAIARESFNHNALSFLEAAFIPYCRCEAPLFTCDAENTLSTMKAGGRPVVVSTGHLGAWELLATLHGVICPMDKIGSAVVRRYGNQVFNDFMIRQRGFHGNQIIGHRNAVMPVLRILRQQGTVIFLVDHHTGSSESLRIPFLGEEAAVNMGPALLAIRGKALIFPLCILRKGEGYLLHIEPEALDPLALEGDNDARIRSAATFYTRAMERMIRLAPEQWFWMHNRWKK